MLQERRIELTEGATGRKWFGRGLVCPDCGAAAFACFFPDGIDHLHFQCVRCGVSFCDGCEAVAGDEGQEGPPVEVQT